MNPSSHIITLISKVEYIRKQLHSRNPHKWELRDEIITMFENEPELYEYYDIDWDKTFWDDRLRRKPQYVEPMPIQLSWPKVWLDECAARYDYDEHFPGLYFLGATYFNPMTNIPYYMVKIGSTHRTVAERLKQYTTHNPMIFHDHASLPFSICPEASESNCHNFLAKHAIQHPERGAEWYMVDKETYLLFCERFQSPFFFAKVASGEM